MENDKIKFGEFGNYGNVDWIKSAEPIDYQNSFDWMLSYVKKIQMGDAKEVIWPYNFFSIAHLNFFYIGKHPIK